LAKNSNLQNVIKTKTMSSCELIYKIGVSLIPGIGDIMAKKLIAYTGSPEAVFKEKKANLLKIPGIGEILAKEIMQQQVLGIAEKELAFIEKYQIQYFYYLDKSYPERLKHCIDSPVIFFMKGMVDLNMEKALSIVGTRNATSYGKARCNKIVDELAERWHDVLIVSGLAYGIDVCAHKAALRNNFYTIGVLGHGLGTLYPSSHKEIAKQISKKGALITDFLSHVQPEKNNFIKRNRIIAGISDATLVVESGLQGGALITADIACSYNRDVLTIPGRTEDKYSKGCNQLIKNNKAALVESAQDIEYVLGWDSQNNTKPVQKQLFVELTEEEKTLVDLLQASEDVSLDHICYTLNLPVSRVSPVLLALEFKGMVKTLPGKIYKLMN
jgi:DNA processing protein